ncbi:MAG: hypothetical protein ACRDRR_20065 [Pseudonocardiaceae bacterium]
MTYPTPQQVPPDETPSLFSGPAVKRVTPTTDVIGIVYLDDSDAATAGTAINAAITSLPSTGGTIVIPSGTWTIDTAVLINKNGIILSGVGCIATRLVYAPGTVPTAIKNTDTTQRFVTIKDLLIDSTGANGGTAIDASFFVNSQFERLRIGDGSTSPQRGVVFDSVGTYYNTVRDCRIQVAGTDSCGILFDHDANSNWVDNVRILGDANTVGIRTAAAHTNTLAHVDCESTMAIALRIRGNNTTVISPYIESVTVGIQLELDTEAFTCFGGFISDCTNNVVDNGAVDPVFLGVWRQFEVYNRVVFTGSVGVGGSAVLLGDRVAEQRARRKHWGHLHQNRRRCCNDVVRERIRQRHEHWLGSLSDPISLGQVAVWMAVGAGAGGAFGLVRVNRLRSCPTGDADVVKARNRGRVQAASAPPRPLVRPVPGVRGAPLACLAAGQEPDGALAGRRGASRAQVVVDHHGVASRPQPEYPVTNVSHCTICLNGDLTPKG